MARATIKQKKNWQRARTPEKVESRRADILHAAWMLFKVKPYLEISLNEIAEKAGLAKSNVYRYFVTREEIFLTMFINVFQKWGVELIQAYQALPEDVRPQKFARTFVNVTRAHEDFLDLCPYLFSALEANSSVSQIVKFKHVFVEFHAVHHKEFCRIYPKTSEAKSLVFLRATHAAAAVLWPQTKLTEALKDVYERPEFKALKPNFEQELESTICALLSGVIPQK